MSKMVRTPKKPPSVLDDSLSSLSPTLSPVVVSPGRSPSAGNLTGSSRKVKDAAADWHNYTDRWRMFTVQGSQQIQKISNIKLNHLYANDAKKEDFEDETVAKGAESMPLEMEKHIEKLQGVYSSLEKLVKKLENITKMLKGVSELEWHQNNRSYCEEPLFKTWPTPRFHEVSKELLVMYQKELDLKNSIIENVAHVNDRDTIMTLSAAWVHEPYIDNDAEFLMESLLVETGHK